MAVAPFGFQFAPPKCKMLLQNWATLVPNMILDGQEITIVDRLT